MIIKPGIYPTMSNKMYHGDKTAISSSGLVSIEDKSPAHLKRSLQKTETDAMRKGTGFHVLTLQPERLDKEIIIADVNLQTKDGRAEYERALSDRERTVLRLQWMDELKEWAAAVRKKRIAREIIDNSFIERSTFWKDEGYNDEIFNYPATKIFCKVRIDADNPELGVLADIKSAKDADYQRFQRVIKNRNYHAQAAFYLDIRNMEAMARLKTSSIVYKQFVWIVLEKGSLEVALYGVPHDHDWILAGRKVYRRALNYYKTCKQKNIWPGYGEEITEIEALPWAM